MLSLSALLKQTASSTLPHPSQTQSVKPSVAPRPQRFSYDYRLLNQDSDDSEASETLWSNLGMWQGGETETYAQACSALASQLGKRAELSAATTVLDVGCGAGDQILLWLREFGVRRVVGCELDSELVSLANERLSDYSEARVEQASATALAHLPTGFDRVLALDCAYHFETRERFVADASRLLRPGGLLVFTDLVLGWPLDHAVGRLVLGPAAKASQVPRSNLVGVAQMQRCLRQAGLTSVEVAFLDRPVLSGFARYARRHRRRWGRSAAGRKLVATGRLCALSYWTRGLRYVLVRAQKPTA